MRPGGPKRTDESYNGQWRAGYSPPQNEHPDDVVRISSDGA